jgi:hypothetical protein
MSFFNPQGIQQWLLVHPELGRGSSNSDTDGTDEVINTFDDDIAMLGSYHLVKLTKDEDVFEMHGLVQLSIRKWLESKGLLGTFKDQFVRVMASEFPNGEYESWATCKILLPHVETGTDCTDCKEHDTCLEEWGKLLHNGACFAQSQGRYRLAEQMARKAWNAHEPKCGEEHKDTLHSRALFAFILSDRGRLDEAERLQLQALGTAKAKLWADHAFTVVSMHNLALCIP